MDDQKTQTEKQQGPLIETMKDGSGQKQSEATDDGMLHVTIVAPEKTLFDGPVESMTSNNTKGTFDILPYHENFISLIIDKVTVREKNKPPQEIQVGNAILKISKNQAEIFVGLEEALSADGTPTVNTATATSPGQPQPEAASK
ncbi:MAG: hypothetical protein KGJ07_00690 [Patescibacteria group bacterium]|nr:hypothetical protein [Patescibacteria group bacterium]MDE2589502.1 hypothetical protein [Patescibacteria group bacterium]